MARAWVEDRWHDRKKARTSRYGVGARWRVRWFDDSDPDKARQERTRMFSKRADADEFAAKLDNDIRASVYRDPALGKATFAEVAEEWLAGHLRIRESTYVRYERELRMYMVPKFGPKPVNSISRADLAAWVADLTRGKAPARYKVRGSNPPRDHPARTMRAPLAPASIEHMVTILGAIFKWAMANDRIAKNPATGLSIPRPVPEDHVYLTHNQVRDLAAAAQNATGDRQDAALVYTLAYTGLRINEALAAKTGALDTAARTLRVAQTWTQGRDGGRKLGPPKSWERRTVPLPGFLADQLAELVQGRGPGEFVFTARRGGPVFDHNWRRRVWDKAVAAAELDGLGLTPHKLRHTAASAAIAAGADVKVVQQMLGHASAAMTLDVYGHLWPSRLGEVAAAMEAARQAEYQTPNPAPKPARPTGPEL